MRTRYALALLALFPLLVLGCDSSDLDDDDLAAIRAVLQCNTIGQITVGQTINGALTAADCRLPGDQSFVDYYAFRLTSATSVRIDLESTAFDPYLFLFNAAGSIIDDDDDGGTDLNARITRQLSAGLYVIGANSYHTGATGAYSLRLSSGN